jgi:alkylhydroperoxidase family enzyme
MDRHADAISALRRAVLESSGVTSPEARSAAAAGAPTETAADDYLRKVRGESYRMADADIEALRRAGLSEDAIFELTLAAALGEATRRFDRVIAALGPVGAARG